MKVKGFFRYPQHKGKTMAGKGAMAKSF